MKKNNLKFNFSNVLKFGFTMSVAGIRGLVKIGTFEMVQALYLANVQGDQLQRIVSGYCTR